MNKFAQMSFADLAADDDMFSAFSAFNAVEEPEETPEEESDDLDTGEEEEKPAKPVKKASKAKTFKKVPGPVTVRGTGWSFMYGDQGEEYSLLDAVKACYEAGYTELACDRVSLSLDGSTVLVKLPEAATDNLAMGEKLVVALGQMKAEYTPGMFGDDVSGDEISVFDVAQKFWETHPDFKGCGLALDQQAGVAVPVLADKLGKKKAQAFCLYQDGGNRTLEASSDEIKASLGEGLSNNAEITLYKSEGDVIFPGYGVKKFSSAGVAASDLVKHDPKGKSRDVKEVFRLPARIFDTYHGETREVTPEDFGGKSKVEEKDVINFLKQYHRKYASTSKKFFCEEENGTIYVSVASGTKG